MRKQGVHASLRLWRVEDELGLSILLKHGVVMIHRHRAVSIPIGGRPDAKDGVVQPIRQEYRSEHGKNCRDEKSSEPRSQARDRCRRHRAKL